MRVGSLDGMRTDYGVLVLVKSVALVALGVAGWLHRRRLLDAIGQAAGRVAFWRLVAAELVLMGVASGVAVALSRTATPVPDEPPPAATPAQLLTGQPLPPPLTFDRLFTQCHPRPAVDRRGRRAAARPTRAGWCACADAGTAGPCTARSCGCSAASRCST